VFKKAQVKGKRKAKKKTTPNPLLEKRKGKETWKGKRKTAALIFFGRSTLIVFLFFQRAGRDLAESACPLTSWPPVAIPLKQIV
jgi:hypothetical protein